MSEPTDDSQDEPVTQPSGTLELEGVLVFVIKSSKISPSEQVTNLPSSPESLRRHLFESDLSSTVP